MTKKQTAFLWVSRILIYISIVLLSTTNYAASLDKELNELIHQTLPNATVGVYIQNLDGTPVYSHFADNLLYPASNIKLYTAAAALYSLGPDYHYDTTLSRLGNDTYITFSGAPDLVPHDLHKLLKHVPDIKGNLILDITRFKPPFYAAGSSYDDIGWYYTAPCHSVILNKNIVEYDAGTPKTDGKLIQLTSKQKEQVLTLVNNVKVVESLVEKEHCAFNIEIKPHNTLHLFGCLAKQEHPVLMSFGVPDPVFFAKRVIRSALQLNHVQLSGKIIIGHTPSLAIPITTHQSVPLINILDYMMKNSDNLYADSITRTMGYRLTHEGTTKQGAYAIKKILTKNSSMDMTHIELSDGIGTRYNLSSPKHIVTLLSHVYHAPKISPIFIQSLPVMGISGSLKDRMNKTPLENKVFAKTGTMHDVSALSGFINTSKNKTLIFSIIINGVPSDINKAKQLEEKILLSVWNNGSHKIIKTT